MVMTIMSSTDEDRSLKEAVSLLNVIGQLAHRLQYDGEEFEQVRSWVHRLCTEQNLSEFVIMVRRTSISAYQ